MSRFQFIIPKNRVEFRKRFACWSDPNVNRIDDTALSEVLFPAADLVFDAGNRQEGAPARMNLWGERGSYVLAVGHWYRTTIRSIASLLFLRFQRDP